ncbi:MAG: hypothetical protein CSB33_02890 [Desulfobacterales bacterium]|nr:MAG: hypothetical protein CSB33_02890 [Desulfobacterales bacterium]
MTAGIKSPARNLYQIFIVPWGFEAPGLIAVCLFPAGIVNHSREEQLGRTGGDDPGGRRGPAGKDPGKRERAQANKKRPAEYPQAVMLSNWLRDQDSNLD